MRRGRQRSSTGVRGLLAVMLAGCAWLLAPTTAGAQTTALFFDSQAGEFIVGGGQHTYTPADATFSIERNALNGVSVSVLGPGYAFWWNLDFSAPGQAALAPGSYAPATRYPFARFTGLDVSGTGRGCNELTGRYIVLEAVYASDGSVDRFAADVEQHCDDQNPGLFAAIRYNSTIADLQPFGGGYPQYELLFSPPDHGRLTGTGVSCGGGDATCSVSFGTPTLAVVEATPDPGFTFAGWTGACTGFRTMNVQVNSVKSCGAIFEPVVPPMPRTLLRWFSAPGEYIGQNRPNVYSGSNSVWTVTGGGNSLHIQIDAVDRTREVQWALDFRAPAGSLLQPGVYLDARRAPFATTTPGLDVHGDGRGCNEVFGSFVVRELVFEPGTTNVSTLAIDFEQHCESQAAPPLAGRLRYNSALDTRVHQVSLESSAPSRYNTAITWTASASPGGDVEYSFFVYRTGIGWTRWTGYSFDDSSTWTPTYEDIGTHQVQVWARVFGSSEDYEAWAGLPITVLDAPHPVVTGIVVSGPQPVPAGQLVSFIAQASGGVGPLQYKFLRLDADGWKVVQDYSSSSSYSWLPGASDAGPHAVQVWVKNDASGAAYEAYGSVSFDVGTPDPLTVSLTNRDISVVQAGHVVSWSPLTTGGTWPLQCRYIRLDPDGWHVVQEYDYCRSYDWTPAAADVGEHALQVWVRNAGSTNAYDVWQGTNTFRVVVDPLGSVSLTPSVVFPVPTSTPVTWTARVSGGIPPLRYQFWVWRSGAGWSLARDYSTLDAFTWTPALNGEGTYVVQVLVRNAGTTAGYDGYGNSGYFTVGAGDPAQIVSISADVALPTPALARITWTAVASGGTAGPLEFQFVRLNQATGVWTIVQPYGISNTYAWNTGLADRGDYVLQVWVRSAGSSSAYEGWAATGPFTIQ